MEENNSSNFLTLDECKSSPEYVYMNIAKRNESNIKKYDKFKPKDSNSKLQNELKSEESKLKIMLYSLIKSETQENKESKISGNIKLEDSGIFSPIKKNIHKNRFSTIIYNLDESIKNERFENKKKITKIKNNKEQKQPLKFSNNHKYSSMIDLVDKKPVYKNKPKKN